MVQHPTGTVTFLFTDIEASTRLWEGRRAWMEQAFARQEQIIREAAAQHNGYVYKMVDEQRALQAEPRGDCGPLHVRMALNTGVTEERGDDYVGPALNRVVRFREVTVEYATDLASEEGREPPS